MKRELEFYSFGISGWLTRRTDSTSGEQSKVSSLDFERANVLYNLCSLQSLLASCGFFFNSAETDRATSEGLTTSCRLFQNAAGSLSVAQVYFFFFLLALAVGKVWSSDLRPALLEALKAFLLV